MVFAGLEEYLYSLIREHQIVYAPFIIDRKDYPEVDLALVEGTVRNMRHFRAAKEAREKSHRLVALGSCACYGGVQGLADMFDGEDLVRERFGVEASQGEAAPVRRLLPLDSYISVDGYLPGCPVPADLMESYLRRALRGDLPAGGGETVCAGCNVSSPPIPREGPRRYAGSGPRKGECLLEQGYVCMGPLTRGGCGAPCPRQGIPCEGCRGPSERVILDRSVDLRSESVRRLSRATGKAGEAVEEILNDPAHTYYRFCLAEPVMRRRKSGGTSLYVRRLAERE
jgi:F420-non-reducing hydrogenase small subunit